MSVLPSTIKSSIVMEAVNLHYVNTAFHHRSLKSHFVKYTKHSARKFKIDDIHALKDITVTIKQGERIALLGHNGAGKSTFLKAVAGLYPISDGRIVINGYIRSLFELSLGFEPDATGRENIMYRGLLLGLLPKEIRKKECEIVTFADLGDFIDYPISTYSAGMQVRLAFAISTAIKGDILLIDEVIGAGDANFMVKAKRRIARLVEQAEIFILASHDHKTLSELCSRGLVFNRGNLIFDGPLSQAIEKYNQECL